MKNLENVINYILLGILIFFMFFFLFFIVLVMGGHDLLSYHFDRSVCIVRIDNKKVYKGKCHFITVESIGKCGNTKKVTIYKDKTKWRPLKVYISDNIKVMDY